MAIITGIRWEELDEDLSFEGFMCEKKNDEKPMLYYIFKDHPELNVSSVARRLGIPQSVMASYLCGIKKPSKERENEIIDTIRKIREELLAVRL